MDRTDEDRAEQEPVEPVEVVIVVDTSAFDRYWTLAEERYDFVAADFDRQVRAIQAALEAAPDEVRKLRERVLRLGTITEP